MKLKFKKGGKKPGILSIVRSDGSETWSAIHRGLDGHDLIHYVLEKKLNLRDAFFGLIDKGYEISDFELPRDQRPHELIPAHMPLQARQAEHIVGLLQTNLQMKLSESELHSMIHDILTQKGLPMIEKLSPMELSDIQGQIHEYMELWQSLSEGDELDLEIFS